MKSLNHLHTRKILLLAAVLLIAVPVFAADPPTVAISATGAVPGATVAAKATVTIKDGSVLQSIAWKQVSGAPVTLSGTSGDTVNVTLPARNAFRHRLVEVLEEPPIEAEHEEYFSGLQNRFTVVGIAPLALEHAGAIGFEMTVVTSSGTYKVPAALHVGLPWNTATGLRNVPTLSPVLLHGKTQATYNWTLTKPTGSTAALVDATTQDPEFTPDVPGNYEVKVTDLGTNKETTILIQAGTWRGVVVGQDAGGRPVVEAACKACHVTGTPHFDLFTPWAASGHGEIFTQNVNNDSASAHYSEACLSCHTVGFDKTAGNGGIDDQADYKAMVDSGVLTHGNKSNWNRILTEFPKSAKLSNIQCENCHGPQDGAAHGAKNGARKSVASEVCGTCHGEPLRHGRFQQWQLSGHGNFELAREEGANASCGKCHSGQGFVQWANNGFSSAALNVTWTTEDVEPITCAVCHDPHSVGTTSGGPTTNAKARVYGNTPKLDAGFTATNVGNAAVCMTCHNGRRGLRDDAHFNKADATRAPHVGPQTDVLMGQNMYFVPVGQKGYHAMIEDSCVTCHMEATAPPAELSYNKGGTNHLFTADRNICSKCHTSITADSVQVAVEHKMEALKVQIETAIKNLMQTQIRSGNSINLNNVKTIKSANDIKAIEFIESHGRQGVAVTLADNSVVPDLSLANVYIVRPTGDKVDLYSAADPALGKAGWNYFMAHSDASHGVHNPGFVSSALDVALFAVTNLNTNPTAGGVNPSVGGGIGNGAGAVTCTTPYVYWAELAAHLVGGNDSNWRTDLVVRNLSAGNATLKFVLHQPEGNIDGTGAVVAGGQKAFEDVVALLGATANKGSLEICSDQPLLVAGRTFNLTSIGTYGQDFDGHVADQGYAAGQTFSLIGMRQKTNAYRSNLSVTNAGTIAAEVSVTLFDGNGGVLKTFNLSIPAGLTVQDVEPFKNRANAPDVDWGFATITVLKGTNIRSSASMVDVRTNDPTTIFAKQ